MKHLYLLCFLVGVVMIGACDDNIHNFTKETGADASNEVYIDAANRTFKYAILRTADEEIQGVDTILAKFPIQTTEEAKGDIRVTLTVDNELVDIYNSKHETAYNRFPSEDLRISHSTLTIPKGTTISTDSMTISCIKPLLELTNTKGYLIPVKIVTSEGIDVKTRIDERVVYLIVDVKQDEGIFFKEGENRVDLSNNPYLNASFKIQDLPLTLHSYNELQDDVNIQLSVNNKLIDAYNSSNGTNYLPVSIDDVELSEVIFQEGDKTGSASLSYTGNINALNDSKGYLIPVEITTVSYASSSENIKRVEAKKTFYVAVNISTLHAERPTDDGEMGVKQTDRMAYKVVSLTNDLGENVVPTAAGLSNAGTGNVNSMFEDGTGYWGIGAGSMYPVGRKTANFTVDLGSEVSNVTGLMLENDNVTVNYIIKTVTVSCATQQMYENNRNTPLGTITNTANGEAYRMLYVKFSEPVSARYIILNDVQATLAITIRNFYIYTAN
ncbi:hypothetical protein EZS27_004877 [termite gut metagenome]|uniref:BT-3987-like N-terminal domain-containing protein n=1 Tax=termite gut metagenome TaxID=433724 RepID=A0A5J4SNH4_9ZZZZ